MPTQTDRRTAIMPEAKRAELRQDAALWLAVRCLGLSVDEANKWQDRLRAARAAQKAVSHA